MGYPAVVTFWFITAANPREVLESEPKADRGFGRKLLAQINPAWPITDRRVPAEPLLQAGQGRVLHRRLPGRCGGPDIR